MSTGRNGIIRALAANQRDEVRDMHDVAAALGAQPGIKQQTFVAGIVSKGNGDCFLTPDCHTALTAGGGQAGQGYPCIFAAGFSAGQGAEAGGIGYQTECAPTLKASESGSNMVPSVLCLNDQGGSVMDCSEDVSGTLRSQEHGHQPLIFASQQGDAELGIGICPAITAAAGMSGNNQPVLFENHGIDARYTGPHPVAPTMSARYGTGGNNLPLIAQGHTVFSRQRVDVFHQGEVVSTQSARQNKDATDLVMEVAGLDCRNGNENGNICGNKRHYRQLREQEQIPVIRKLLERDMMGLDRLQVQMATAREFFVIVRLKNEKDSDIQSYLSRIQKNLEDQGFKTRLSSAEERKRMLGVYLEQNATTEKYEDYDGERWVIFDD